MAHKRTACRHPFSHTQPCAAHAARVNTRAKYYLLLAPRFIIGQDDAKRAVAVAYRNRWRRKRVPAAIRDDIVPKNILMCGPTGCGKTEIARRLAKLANSPFVKVRGAGTGAGGHREWAVQIVSHHEAEKAGRCCRR